MILPFKIEGYSFEIVRKKIKNIYFRVYHTPKKIIVSAPVGISSKTLNQAISSKQGWLEKQALKHPPETFKQESAFPFGNHLMFKGRKLPVSLHYAQGRPKILKEGEGGLHVYARPGVSDEKLKALVDQWYRKKLNIFIKSFVEKWEPSLGVKVNEYRIKKMKTRWGSCNITKQRIWLNAALITLDLKYLEYVVVHEMVHLLERSHNARFNKLMDSFIPKWPLLKKELNRIRI